MTLMDRSPTDRRSGKDRRKKLSIQRLLRRDDESDPDRRHSDERRSTVERREGWVRIGKWAGVCLEKLKIARFLR